MNPCLRDNTQAAHRCEEYLKLHSINAHLASCMFIQSECLCAFMSMHHYFWYTYIEQCCSSQTVIVINFSSCKVFAAILPMCHPICFVQWGLKSDNCITMSDFSLLLHFLSIYRWHTQLVSQLELGNGAT